MTRTTSFHGWSVPEKGDDDYASTFDAWFDDLDLDTPRVDTLANRPPAGTDDRFYVAEDEPALYLDDGASWNKIAGRDFAGETINPDHILASRGSASDAAYAFRDDTNSGLFSPGPNTLALSTAGTSAITINSSQDVTIDEGPLLVPNPAGVSPLTGTDAPLKVKASATNKAISLETGPGRPDAYAANINAFTEDQNYVSTVSFQKDDNSVSFYHSDADSATTDGNQVKGFDIIGGQSYTTLRAPNLRHFELGGTTGNATEVDFQPPTGEIARLNYWQNNGGSRAWSLDREPGTGRLLVQDWNNSRDVLEFFEDGSRPNFPHGVDVSTGGTGFSLSATSDLATLSYQDGAGADAASFTYNNSGDTLDAIDSANSLYLFRAHLDGSQRVNFQGTLENQGNAVLTTADQDVVASGTVTLSEGSAIVSTGLTSGSIDVALDPSAGGANTSDVKVSARAFYDSSVPEIKVEIVEDGTTVDSPDIGYEVVEN